jgi:hypothetical protein
MWQLMLLEFCYVILNNFSLLKFPKEPFLSSITAKLKIFKLSPGEELHIQLLPLKKSENFINWGLSYMQSKKNLKKV